MEHALNKASLPILALLAGCATEVYHPGKTQLEMKADVDLCSDEASRKHWLDPLLALYEAYDCLEAKGYSRTENPLARQVQKAAAEPRKPKRAEPVQPCRVPCR